MKLSKLIASVSVLVLGAALLNSAPANAACYWQRTGNGDEQILVIDSTGQCTLDSGTPVVDPNPGSTPTPSAPSTPMPSATATPIVEATPAPTPTPVSTPSPTSSAKPRLVTHWVRDVPDSVNSFPMKRIQITDVDDSNYSAVCYYAFTCELAMPEGHRWSYSLIADYEFAAAMEGVADWYYALPYSQKAFDNYIVNRVIPAGYPTQIWFMYKDSPFMLKAQTDKTQEFGFDNFGRSTGTPIKLEQGQPITITQSIKTLKKPNWSNLPAGLVEEPDGTISGRPTASGIFTVEAKFGPKTSIDTYKFTIEVAPGVETPTELKSARTDLTSANFAFSTEVSSDQNTIPDFFEIELKNTRTSKVELKFFEGSSRAGIFRDLLPGDTYKVRMRAAKANPLRYSAYSQEIEIKPQTPAQYFTTSKGALKISQTWLEGSSTSIAVSIPAVRGGQVQARIPKSAKVSVTKAQAKAFSDYYDGLFMNKSGEITGTVSKTDIARKPLTLKLGSVSFVFRFEK